MRDALKALSDDMRAVLDDVRRVANDCPRLMWRVPHIAVKAPLIRYGRRKARSRVAGFCVIGRGSSKGWQRRRPS